MRRIFAPVLLVACLLALPAFGYGTQGHETVGAIADKLLANQPEGRVVSDGLMGMTLERASTLMDAIKEWDKAHQPAL